MSDAQAAAAALLEGWAGLSGHAAGDRLFRSVRLSGEAPLSFHLALRNGDGAPCLLATPDEAVTDVVQTFETGGLRLSRTANAGRAMLVLSLEAPERRDLFALVCADIVGAAVGTSTEADALAAAAGRLAAWRAFLRDRSAGLDRAGIVGLIGELLILGHLLDRGRPGLSAWRAPDDGLHDFALDGWALEVKTSLGTASRIRISNLDQMDGTGLARLFLAHVRLAEDGAGDDLPAVVTQVEARMTGERTRRDFRNALLRRGLGPDELDRSFGRPRVRVVKIDFRQVIEGFPCLTRFGVPAGVVEAGYDLDPRTLVPFAVDADAVIDSMTGNVDG